MSPAGKASVVTLNHFDFYRLVDIINAHRNATVGSENEAKMAQIQNLLGTLTAEVDVELEELKRISRSISSVDDNSRRRKNPFSSLQEQEDSSSSFHPGTDFVSFVLSLLGSMQGGLHGLRDALIYASPPALLVRDPSDRGNLLDSDEQQKTMMEIQFNSDAVLAFALAVEGLAHLPDAVLRLAQTTTDSLDQYYNTLVRRHSVEGFDIHVSPLATDVALSIFANVDSHGEIASGKKPDEISAYSINKAELLIDQLNDGIVHQFLSNPGFLIGFIQERLRLFWGVAELVCDYFFSITAPIYKVLRKTPPRVLTSFRFESVIDFISDLDPQRVTAKEKDGILTAEERFDLDFKNETVAVISEMLVKQSSSREIVQYILARKSELRNYFENENTFYTCRIGNGNPFLGDPPGALQISPANRPVVDLSEIVGSGFSEVKDFIDQIESSSAFHDLFMATSPSRSADKSNVLLIGPQGCGKSEILRAVGGDQKSVGIFAQGSDFLTCWKGEAEKNPKRLFEGALKIQKSSKKHVHILIDEIDSVLNKSAGLESFGGTNLTTEFQILMDGVVRYPSLSVWGATNHPGRIPMPMIRRFSKVLIVGELTQDDRIALLRHFSSFLPLAVSTTDREFAAIAQRLEGATGDVIRKVVDAVWREKMTSFVRQSPDAAKKMVEELNRDEKGDRISFNIAKFDSNKRDHLHRSLVSNGVQVTPADLSRSTDYHLNNIAIQHEIETAVSTYRESRKLVRTLEAEAEI